MAHGPDHAVAAHDRARFVHPPRRAGVEHGAADRRGAGQPGQRGRQPRDHAGVQFDIVVHHQVMAGAGLGRQRLREPAGEASRAAICLGASGKTIRTSAATVRSAVTIITTVRQVAALKFIEFTTLQPQASSTRPRAL